MRTGRSWKGLWALAVGLVPLAGVALALPGDDFDEPPISYSSSAPADPVARLQQQLSRGEVTLAPEGARGYLAPLLRALKVPASSQTLVFSKTSFQRDRISPETPRALYFNDDVYVGWVQGSDVVELSTADPNLGAVFYTLDVVEEKPKLVRRTDECLQCHSSTLTRGVPGHLVRSVFPDPAGLPILSAGTYNTTDESPWNERWGGWYVTGRHGAMRHMGNTVFKDAARANGSDLAAGANVTDLRGRVDTAPYLTRHSDVVALMVLEHQTHVHNLITRANFQTRLAMQYEEALGRELGRPAGGHLESTLSRVKSVAEPLVRALLFVKEAPLTAPVAGTSTFTAEFSAQGPRDPAGRSLRDFDLKKRLFRYSCSYLIYSEAFDALPDLARSYVYRRLWEVVEGKEQGEEFAHLSVEDRQALRDILLHTKPDFAAARPR
jgi:hypothetical protein